MSAEESTPSERADRAADAASCTGRDRPEGRVGARSGAEDTTSASAATEEVSSELIALDFGVHKSIRYHVKRRAFFDVMHRVAMLIAVIGGSAAFFALIGEKTEVGQIAALTVAIATALDLIFAFPENAREHDKLAAVAAAREEDAAFAARIEGERGMPVEVTVPIEVIEAKLDGAHPIKAWRECRDWTQLDLAARSGVSRDLIAQLETRRKKGGIETLSRIARALGVPIEGLIEDKEI